MGEQPTAVYYRQIMPVLTMLARQLREVDLGRLRVYAGVAGTVEERVFLDAAIEFQCAVWPLLPDNERRAT